MRSFIDSFIFYIIVHSHQNGCYEPSRYTKQIKLTRLNCVNITHRTSLAAKYLYETFSGLGKKYVNIPADGDSFEIS